MISGRALILSNVHMCAKETLCFSQWIVSYLQFNYALILQLPLVYTKIWQGTYHTAHFSIYHKLVLSSPATRMLRMCDKLYEKFLIFVVTRRTVFLHFLGPHRWVLSECFEWFIEAKAFFGRMIRLLAHPLPTNSRQQVLVCRRSSRGGVGVGEEPNHTNARKPGPL